jgi:hypothetical protein
MVIKANGEKAMQKLYEVLFYSGDQPLPAYYVFDHFEADNMKEVENRLAKIMQSVRTQFAIGDEVYDHQIRERLYIIGEDGITSVDKIAV